ncbi:MAG: thiol:disulfide interchange protein DsbA/DsbL [Gammaproteobacteria bacterium]|nr:thiol:disulfide interchange protein DsbA/DsbL [Gammaproteobacteria bacterium]
MNSLRCTALVLALGLAACSKPEAPAPKAEPTPQPAAPSAPQPAPVTAPAPAASQPASVLREGENFRVASQDAESAQPKVVEFFSYGCPACYGMEAFMADYKAKRPKSIVLDFVPVPIHDEKGLLMQAYYIGKRLGMLEKSHGALFRHLHDEKKHIESAEDLTAFFVALGASPSQVKELVNSQGILDEAKAGVDSAVKFGVQSTPSFVVNDKYYTDGRMAKENLGAVFDALALRNKPAIFQ